MLNHMPMPQEYVNNTRATLLQKMKLKSKKCEYKSSTLKTQTGP